MVLPVTLPYQDDEAAIDLVARLAAANGYPSLQEFLAHTETTANAIVHGETDALSLVSAWSEVSVTRLGQLAAVANGHGGTWRMGCATLSKDMRPGRVQRFCAHCVLEDRECKAGRMVARAYRRAWWSIRGIEGCPIHGCRLTEVEGDAVGDVHDFSSFVTANLSLIEQAGATPIPTRQPGLDRYLCERLFTDDGTGFLDKLEVHVATEFSRYLGDFLVLHDVQDRMPEGTGVSEWGFLVASGGEAAIRTLIAEVIDRKPPKKRQVETVLGPMVRWLRRNLAKPGYQTIVGLVQDILERNMPFGPGETILKPAKARHLYCVNTAHEDFGLTKERIRALMKANDPEFRDGLPDASTYFDAAKLQPILHAAQDTLTSKEAGMELGLREERVRDLLKAGLLRQVEARAGEERAYTRVRRADLDHLTDRLISNLTDATGHDGLISLTEASRTWRRPFHTLVSMVLEKNLEAFLVAGDDPVLQRMRVKVSGLHVDGGRCAGGNEDLMRLKEVELAIGTTTATIAELIEHGYLHVQVQRRETGRHVRFVGRQSFTEFDAEYLSLSAIAKSRKGFRAVIKSELDALGILPIYEPTGFNARFYRRSDLDRVGFDV